jgi:hypothetical protein
MGKGDDGGSINITEDNGIDPASQWASTNGTDSGYKVWTYK